MSEEQPSQIHKTATSQPQQSNINGDIAAVFGATGACGSHIVEELLSNDEIGQVYCFTRRTTTKHLQNPKYKEIILTDDLSADLEQSFPRNADVVFSGLATTINQAGSEEKMQAIDYGMNDTIATFARKCNVPQYFLISSVGANAESSFFYMRLKGELDQRIEQLNFPRSVIYRPGCLIGAERSGFRMGEWILEKFIAPLWCCTSGFFGKLHPITVSDVGKAMVLDYIAHRYQNQLFRQQYIIERTSTVPLKGQHVIVDGSMDILKQLDQYKATSSVPKSNLNNNKKIANDKNAL